MGLAYIFTKKGWTELADIQDMVNALERGLQIEVPNMEQVEQEEEESMQHQEDNKETDRTESEKRTKLNIIAEVKKFLDNIENRLDNIETMAHGQMQTIQTVDVNITEMVSHIAKECRFVRDTVK
eukprot:1335514-Heterocapsa_arctica.AAC.1